MSEKIAAQEKTADAIFAGRIAILYALGRHYLSLPFAVLCVAAAILGGKSGGILPLLPLILQIMVVVAAERLTAGFKKRPPESDCRRWARRFTLISALSGASWGVACYFWFVRNSFPAQACLALAFLGMTATEFIARSAYRPAYVAHTLFSLSPLIVLLLLEGGLYPILSAILIALFAAVLISYCHGMARLLEESVELKNEKSQLVETLQREKHNALHARDAAQANVLAKAQFIANISHELRTPLNALLGMAQLLERAELPKQQRDHVKVMVKAGRGLQTLIDDIFALTRDDADQLSDEDCDPLQAARAVIRLLQPRAWEKQLHLSLSASAQLPRVAADPKKVRQALLKLTDNALKFTERGLVDVRLELDDECQMVRFIVSDTGHGVAAEAAPTLFSPFSPGDSSYARKQQGAGMGLAVAKRIVEQAGGTIGYDSKPGEGAQFFFALPVSGLDPHRETLAQETDHQHTPPTGLSLLLFLRASAVGEAISRLLEPFGNHVLVAESLAMAAERAGREQLDGVIASASDVDMLAAVPGLKAPLIAILLRGERAPSATDATLPWPFDADELYRTLNDLCVKKGESPGHEAPGLVPAIDPIAFTTLEKSVGIKKLIEILQCYVVTAEQLTNALSQACAEENWEEAARLAHDIVGAAGALGLAAITKAARDFAAASRNGQSDHHLRSAAQLVICEHNRARQALASLYPEVA